MGAPGLLFPSDDPGAFAALIARMADPDLRTRLAQAGRQHVEQHYSQAALVAATVAVYERCLCKAIWRELARWHMRTRVNEMNAGCRRNASPPHETGITGEVC
jgi:hypothetical protein